MAETSSPFFQSDHVDSGPMRHALLLRLLRYLKPYALKLGLLFILMGAGALLEVLPSEFTLRLIDHHIARGTLEGSGPLILAFLGLLLLGMVLHILRFALLAWIGQMAMLDLRMALFSHLMRRSTHFFHHNPVGRLMTRVTTDVQNLNEMFSSGFVAIVGDALALLAIVIWMFLKHPGLALVAVGILPFLLVATEVFRRKAGDAFRETQGRYAAIQSFLQEQLSGASLVQINSQEDKSRTGFAALNTAYLKAFIRTIFAYAVFFPVVELITAGTLAALIYYAGWKLEHGALSFGLLLAFIQQSSRFFRPIRELAERYNVMQTAMASSERIFRLLDDQDEVPQAAHPLPVRFEQAIRFEEVSFAYEPGGRSILEGITGVLPRGRRVAVVGPTGAGKSTLINLLLRFYDAGQGRVTVDGVDVRELDLGQLRCTFGLVLQDVFVFSGSLQDNITLGRPLDPIRLAEVLEQSQLDTLVARLPEGLATAVGDRGQRLSAGERQLVAFARMLYGNPAVLVLDEATANIDAETESRIQAVIQRVSHRLTTFTIAHRLSTIRDADEIWVLDQGRIVERGRHDELVARGGTYAKLVDLQFQAAEGA